MRCSKCNFENPEGMKFCGQCTNPLALICPKCRFENPAGFKCCGQCTAPLGVAAKSPVEEAVVRINETKADSSVIDGERKTVTALFADIKGSMELMEDFDPEEARAIVDPALKLMIDAVHRYVYEVMGPGPLRTLSRFSVPLITNTEIWEQWRGCGMDRTSRKRQAATGAAIEAWGARMYGSVYPNDIQAEFSSFGSSVEKGHAALSLFGPPSDQLTVGIGHHAAKNDAG